MTTFTIARPQTAGGMPKRHLRPVEPTWVDGDTMPASDIEYDKRLAEENALVLRELARLEHLPPATARRLIRLASENKAVAARYLWRSNTRHYVTPAEAREDQTRRTLREWTEIAAYVVVFALFGGGLLYMWPR